MNELNQTILFLVEKLKEVDYCFIGSASLFIRGAKLNPRDIDILVEEKDFEGLKTVLTKEIGQEPLIKENKIVYSYQGVEVEAMIAGVDPLRDPGCLQKKENVEFSGILAPCMCLPEEILVYQKLGRVDRVEQAENILKNKKT